MKKYIPSEVEPKWQKKWAEDKIYASDLTRPKKFYVLGEFPFTSGDLHMGHWFTFAGADCYARFKRMQGDNVFFPISGYDAFGLPAENAAIKSGVHPQDWTLANIDRMREQFRSVGTCGSFDHEIITCLPEYYKWNQWIFLKMFKRGLAYRGKLRSNWCNTCQTVLANEAIEAGACWRCHSGVVQKEVEQWFLKITDYADRLIWPEIPKVDWPRELREGQNNWIGKSEGALIKFENIEVFTTRPDTLFGATFLVVSPEHSLLKDLTEAKNLKEVEEYIAAAKKKSELERKENKEKTGVFTGAYVKNPLNGEKIPVWVADYVLPGYGTGAIMAVPAHDPRDFEFAKKFDLPIKPVVLPQREYIDDKADDYFARRTENNKRIIKDLASRANENNKKLLLMGGWAVGVQVGKLFREYDDIDVIILEEDLGWWRTQLEDLGLELSNMFPEGMNDKYYFQATKPDVHVDVLTFKIDGSELVSLTGEKPEKLGHSFDEMFDLKKIDDEPVYAMKPEFIYEWKKDHQRRTGDIRWKEQADFLMLGFEPYEGEGVLANSGEFNGLPSNKAIEKISDYLEGHQIGKKFIYYHLHDWSISRQRYWGTPIPVIHCNKCGIVPVPEEDLPVELPYDVDYTPKGKPPLASNEAWLNVKCPKCGGAGKRDPETMDGFVDSSWYFFRYLDPKFNSAPFDKALAQKIMPVDIYFGGAEHTVGHTLYSRFFTKFLHDLGLTDLEEYATRRINHGVVLGPDGSRMSKSKGNVINPDEEVKKYGADAVRVHMAFFMPYDGTGPWISERIWGPYRFLERVWGLQDKVAVGHPDPSVDGEGSPSKKDLVVMNKTIKKVGEDIENISFNTAVAALMEWLNYLSRKEKVSKEEYKTLLLLLAPFAPHMTEELWSFGFAQDKQNWSVHQQSWPEFDEKYLEEEEITIAVSVNGKLRDQFVIQKDIANDRKVVEKMAKELPKIQKYLEGKEVKKTVYIPVKIINFVISEN